MKTQIITTEMGSQLEVEAYVPLFEFETTSADWTKAIVWAGIMPLLIFQFVGAMWMITYVLIGAGLYGFARKFTPVSVSFYIFAFISIGWWIAMAFVITLGAVSAAIGV